MSLYQQGQRVKLPGSTVQAVITDVIESVLGFPVYDLSWVKEDGALVTGTVGEGDLACANCHPVIEVLRNKINEIELGAAYRTTSGRKPAAVAKSLRNRKR